jgi:MFS family permease
MSLQPTFGKIYTLFDLKWTYTSALLIFEIGSLICAVAPSSVALIIGRAVAGVGASGILCGGLVLISHVVQMQKRPVFMGLLSSMWGISSVIGRELMLVRHSHYVVRKANRTAATFGGLFTDSPRLTWRFCFWINLRGLIPLLSEHLSVKN